MHTVVFLQVFETLMMCANYVVLKDVSSIFCRNVTMLTAWFD